MDLDSPGKTLFRKPGRMELCGYDVSVFETMHIEHQYKGVKLTVRFWPDMKSKDFAAIASVQAIGTTPGEMSRHMHHCDGPFSVRRVTEVIFSAIEEMHARVDIGVWAPASLVYNEDTWAYDAVIHEIYMLLKEQKGESDGTDDAG